MTHPVRLERRNGIALIAIENPPVNALGAAVRLGILAALEAALEDASVDKIVLAANGPTFPVGADIKEFGHPARAPSLPDLCDVVEASPKPVIAALHGTVLGGGLELALAAHYRVAEPETMFGLPEVKLGLLPGAGGTQRLPRLIPIENALAMMLKGGTITAAQAERLGLIDGIAPDELRETVKQLAGELDTPRPTRLLRHRLTHAAGFIAAISRARQQLSADDIARTRIVDCVEAALLVPFETGLEMERAAFEECLTSDRSIGLRHAFFAERQAQKIPGARASEARPLDHIGVVGDGVESLVITLSCLNRGLPVTHVASSEAAVTQALDQIGLFYEEEAQSGRLTQAQGAGALSKLALTTNVSLLSQADLIVESAGAQGPTSAQVLRELGQSAKQSAVLCTNNPSLGLETLAGLTGRPQDTLPLHFFSLEGELNLVELGFGEGIAPSALATAFSFVKRLGKTPIRVGGSAGLIADTMMSAYFDAADAFLLRGASPNQVDTAMQRYGMAQGPYALQDKTSIDVVQSKRVRNFGPVLFLPDRLVEAGCIGRSVGQGYYIYDTSGHAQPNDEVIRILAVERRERGLAVSPSTNQQIQHGIVAALVNAGTALLQAETALAPGDIDAVMLHGMGFPREKGGPMHQADRLGAFHMLGTLQEMFASGPSFCEIAPLLRKKAAEREGFAS